MQRTQQNLHKYPRSCDLFLFSLFIYYAIGGNTYSKYTHYKKNTKKHKHIKRINMKNTRRKMACKNIIKVSVLLKSRKTQL